MSGLELIITQVDTKYANAIFMLLKKRFKPKENYARYVYCLEKLA